MTNVIVKDSLIQGAGRGVFANCDFKKGDYVCFYDGEDILNKPLNYEEHEYAISDSSIPGITRIGFKNPKIPDGVGQLINDRVIFKLSDKFKDSGHLFHLSDERIDKAISLYQDLSKKYANVDFIKMTKDYKFHAIRNIKEGEELYFNYGIGYWLSTEALLTEYIFTRLFCCLKGNTMKIKGKDIYFNDKKYDIDDVYNEFRIHKYGRTIETLGFMNHNPTDSILKMIEMIK